NRCDCHVRHGHTADVLRRGRRKAVDEALALSRQLDAGARRLAQVPWSGWLRFERELRDRSFSPPGWMPDWWPVRPGHVVECCRSAYDRVLTAALLSMQSNG